MAHLDKEAEPIVVALMLGRSLSLDAASQQLLARWGLKMAYVAEHLHPAKRRNVPREHKVGLREGRLPRDSYVYAACFRGTPTGWNRLRTFDVYDSSGQTFEGKGYMLAMILGQLAIRVLGYPEATGKRPANLSPAVDVWVKQLVPQVAPVVVLPPDRCWGDDTLYRFTDELPFGRTVEPAPV
jgi:hypothetical protein